MTIDITGRTIVRIAAVTAATIGVGASAFFGGQATRMNDDAVASQRHDAVTTAVVKTEKDNAIEIAGVKADDKAHEAKAVRKAARKAMRITRKQERKRAEKLAERARSEGYTNGNATGFSTGHSAGVNDGIDEASDELTCSDDSDVALPACDTYWDY